MIVMLFVFHNVLSLFVKVSISPGNLKRRSSFSPKNSMAIGDRVENEGFSVPEWAREVWCGMKSAPESSRYPSERRDRVENEGFFVPERALEACYGMKSGLRPSRSPSERRDRGEIVGFFVPERGLEARCGMKPRP